jgi:hypothetical protein
LAPNPTNAAFQSFSRHVLNARGESAFAAMAQETAGGALISGLWSDAGGHGMELVARGGDQAPGAEQGATFASFMFPAPQFILNARGQLAFSNTLQGPSINDSNNEGLWAQDPLGNLTLIARRGQLLNVSDDPLAPDWRTISDLRVDGAAGNDDGRRSWFNDRGQLAFWAAFTDGNEGIFVSNAVAVPEPCTAALLLAGIILRSLRRVSPLSEA